MEYMKNYQGKTAWWLILIFLVYNLLPLLTHIKITPFSIVMLVLFYALNIFWIPVFIRNRIELYDTYFIFYYGFSKQIIQISDIKKIEKSRSAIASSANSLDRIHMITKDMDFYVSLKQNDDFINQIQKKR